MQHIDKLDSTLGLPDEQLVVITTIHRTKGLEYDYVFIPSFQEGNMPCLYDSGLSVYDTRGIVKEPDPSETIESERRLCYVALTRARKAVYIGVNRPPKGGKQEESSVQLPSRFLDEMELSAVKPLMDALQDTLTTGRSQQRLVELAQRYRNNHRLLSSLQDAYLRHIPGEELRTSHSEHCEGRGRTSFCLLSRLLIGTTDQRAETNTGRGDLVTYPHRPTTAVLI